MVTVNQKENWTGREVLLHGRVCVCVCDFTEANGRSGDAKREEESSKSRGGQSNGAENKNIAVLRCEDGEIEGGEE